MDALHARSRLRGRLAVGTVGRLPAGESERSRTCLSLPLHTHAIGYIRARPAGRMVLRRASARWPTPCPGVATGERGWPISSYPALKQLTEEQLLPVLETAYPEPPKILHPPPRSCSPKPCKSCARDTAADAGLGDSVTVGTAYRAEPLAVSIRCTTPQRFPKRKSSCSPRPGAAATRAATCRAARQRAQLSEKCGAAPDLVVRSS